MRCDGTSCSRARRASGCSAFCEAYEVRAQYSPLGALFQTEIGPLNEVIHIWPYENLQHRADTRAAASKDTSGKWPPSSASHLIVTQETDILDPIPGRG